MIIYEYNCIIYNTYTIIYKYDKYKYIYYTTEYADSLDSKTALLLIKDDL